MTAHKQVIEIYRRLPEIGHAADDGYWQYADGWSDERLGQEIGTLARSVAVIRTSNFGKLRPKVGQTRTSVRMDLERLVEALHLAATGWPRLEMALKAFDAERGRNEN